MRHGVLHLINPRATGLSSPRRSPGGSLIRTRRFPRFPARPGGRPEPCPPAPERLPPSQTSQHERHKLLGRRLRAVLPGSAGVPQGPDGAAAHGGALGAGHGPLLHRTPGAAAPLPAHPLRPDLAGPLQQHAGVIVDGSQGGPGQGTVRLRASVKERDGGDWEGGRR